MTDYFIDYTNGNDASLGTRVPAGNYDSTTYNTIDSTADTTHFVDTALTGVDDYINGGYFYNVTRSAGSVISDFVALTDTVTLASPIASMAAGDTYYILASWKTVAKYTTTTTRTAGDRAFIRANQSHTITAAIAVDEDGTLASLLSLIGCNATQLIDPYHDSSDVRPILNMNNAAYYLAINGDDYWYLKNLDLAGTNSANLGPLMVYACVYLVVENCIIRDSASSTAVGAIVRGTGNCVDIKFIDCQFTNNDASQFTVASYRDNAGTAAVGNVSLIRCTFTGGTEAPDYGLNINAGNVYLQDCTCVAGAHGTKDIIVGGNAYVRCRNCIFPNGISAVTNNAILVTEDTGGIYQAASVYKREGVISRETTQVRPGGASTSAKMQTISGVSPRMPFTLSEYPHMDFSFREWCAATTTTFTIYMKEYGGWTWTASELYVTAEYITDDASGAITRAVVQSTEAIVDTGTWTPFTCTVTPHVEGFVNLTVVITTHLGSSYGVYVDIKPVVS